MGDGKHINIYLRTRINEGGLHYKPGPVIEARQYSDLVLNIQFLDLSSDKSPINLNMTHVRFIVRKHKYPVSNDDILIDLHSNSGITHKSVHQGIASVNIISEILTIPTTDYWYDVLLYEVQEEDLFANSNASGDDIKRPPLGVFKVVK